MLPWITVAFVGVCNAIIIYFTFANGFTRLRTGSLAGGFMNLGLGLFNALRDFEFAERRYWPTYGFTTITYMVLIDVIILNVGTHFQLPGGQMFHYSRQLFWAVIIFLSMFTVLGCVTMIRSMIYKAYDTVGYTIFCIDFILSFLAGSGAAIYTFTPLMFSRGGREDGVSEALVIGLWYLSTVTMVTIGFCTLYIVLLSNGKTYFLLPNNQSIDIALRMLYLVAIACPPPRKFLRLVGDKIARAKGSLAGTTSMHTPPHPPRDPEDATELIDMGNAISQEGASSFVEPSKTTTIVLPRPHAWEV
ncbi:hypothetical protein BC938DRAFT_474972 [Jimgerdemannia flammicorona]|uniref:Uncharacterized protein n=1 Tax=Jimgerdemannia flammicorona TaxID=994334 RepID=A0A433Q1I2_9FUNG|nr:hypothetical protein BC938DRAFT_474972 [Jimgerdemannia flammicorona]